MDGTHLVAVRPVRTAPMTPSAGIGHLRPAGIANGSGEHRAPCPYFLDREGWRRRRVRPAPTTRRAPTTRQPSDGRVGRPVGVIGTRNEDRDRTPLACSVLIPLPGISRPRWASRRGRGRVSPPTATRRIVRRNRTGRSGWIDRECACSGGKKPSRIRSRRRFLVGDHPRGDLILQPYIR